MPPDETPVGRRRLVRAGGIDLECFELGTGPLVVLLHGFPDCAHTWRFQAAALAAAGYRVVSPNMRGYGGSSKPGRVADYRVEKLAADVAALVAALGETQAAAVVGHDWGGVVAWQLQAQRPDVSGRYVMINAPHPARFSRELSRVDQALRSWYAFFFQLPRLPERLLRANDFALVRRSVFGEARRPGAITRADWSVMRDALAAPGALSAALHYYRAAGRRIVARGRVAASPSGGSTPPVLLLWGDRDSFLVPRLADRLERFVPGIVVRRFASAGHWVQWDEHEGVTRAILDFLSPARR